MSVYFDIILIVRGNAQNLDDFVYYFEKQMKDTFDEGDYKDMNCYVLEVRSVGLQLDFSEYEFPQLKLEYIEMSRVDSEYKHQIFLDIYSLENRILPISCWSLYQEDENRCDKCYCRLEVSHWHYLCQECGEFENNWKISRTIPALECIRAAIESQTDSLVIEDLKIKELPVELWQMCDLHSLEIRNCYQLENIPSSISQLKRLENCKIIRSKISSLPDEFWQLKNLTSLEISVCPNLSSISEEIGHLQNLESLSITGCESLESLPDSICQLNQLKTLSIMNCENLYDLPVDLSNLSNLKSLRIIKCENLSFSLDVHDLPNLAYLETDDDWWILEEDFPQAILDNAVGSSLRVVNQNRETIAYFYNIGRILNEKIFESPEDFCSFYDQIYEDYVNWDQAGLNPECSTSEEQVEDYKKVVQDLQWEPGVLMKFKVREDILKLMGLCRLAYPYCCQVKRLEEALVRIDTVIYEDIFSLDDMQVVRKAFELEWIEIADVLPQIIEKDWVYEHPDYWLTQDNIEYTIDFASQKNLTELTAFLLDYKNKMFRNAVNYSLESKPLAESDLWQTSLNIDGSLTIRKYKGTEKIVEIPGFINDQHVRQIASMVVDQSIFDEKDVKTIIIKEGVEVVGPYAFYGCEKLESIELPKGLTTIHRYAFYGCSALKSIQLPPGLTRIHNFAFAECRNLEEINLPTSLQWIGSRAFSRCHNLESIIIPEDMKKILYGAFLACGTKLLRLQYNLRRIYPPDFRNFEDCTILSIIHSYAHQYAIDNDIPFVEADLVYGFSPFGLVFMPECRVKELADFYKALVTAKTWGEFRESISKQIYEFYLPESMHYLGPNDGSIEDLQPFYIPDETSFTPNDIFTFDNLPGNPLVEMARWVPIAIQKKFGDRFNYIAEDMNIPAGEGLELDETQLDEIVEELEARGFNCQRDDELILAATTSDYDPEDFDDPID